MKALAKEEISEPTIYSYYDYRKYLVDWLEYKSQTEPKFSIRKFCLKTGVSVSLFSMILKSNSAMSARTFESIKYSLELKPTEIDFLSVLIRLSDSSLQSEREKAFNDLFQFIKFRNLHQKEVSSYKYLNFWYYPAIRELATLDDFNEDPKWIKSKLSFKITVQQAREAIEFLVAEGFLLRNPEGKLKPADASLECEGGIYQLSMANYYKQMNDLSGKAFNSVQKDNRKMRGHTISVAESDVEKIKTIIIEASEKIMAISQNAKKTEAVYQVCLSAFSLIKEGPNEKDN